MAAAAYSRVIVRELGRQIIGQLNRSIMSVWPVVMFLYLALCFPGFLILLLLFSASVMQVRNIFIREFSSSLLWTLPVCMAVCIHLCRLSRYVIVERDVQYV